MKAENVLRSFERCLQELNLDKMTKDLYEFFHLRCGFIAHYDINGFRVTYSSPESFLGFIKELKLNLEGDIKNAEWHDYFTDNTDSFKYDYNFKIPEVKTKMLNLTNKYMNKTIIDCKRATLDELENEKKFIEKKITSLKTELIGL